MSIYRLPAEWEKHTGTITTYPQAYETFFDRLEQAQETFSKFVSTVSLSEKVFINVDNRQKEEELLKKLKKYDANRKNVKIFINQTDDAWCRDYCPIFVKENSKTVAVKFRFNAWGGKYPFQKDEKAGRKIAELLGFYTKDVDMVLEGGSIDTNGKGCLITTESCLLNPNRNPDMSREDIEKNLRKYLGVQKILWLKEGIVGDDTDGHVDDITRFVAEDTIVTAIEKDKNDPNYAPLMENFERLKNFTDIKGNPFKIITLPMPEPVFYRYPDSDEPERLPASYANFYITNKHVIVPLFNSKQDEIALDILQKVFKDRKVVGIYAYDILVGLGGFHCLTMQVPE
ncbi:agmatine deiminase [Persephonella hydrogeniphila]|uniref:Agmatine deiminase n=1 Tax=Persephonella hydrogeniphila TaxID=198703 RepID=A0A285NFZ9_9AQUI|nr:agmatine deiminase family protein [Persephonella hydrogeniphila]SNZ08198.1 agmatine deiminase [Persephonella hydrogeniphila]